MRVAFLFIFLFLFSCAPALGQAPAPVPGGIEEAYLAKDDGEGKAGEQTAEFRTSDVPIYCVVLLDSISKTVVKMNFVAVKVSGVKAETKVVTASYTTKEGQNRVNFTGRPDGKWTPGKYRVDLFLDGKLAKNLELEIKGVGVNTNNSAFQEPGAKPPKPASRRRP